MQKAVTYNLKPSSVLALTAETTADRQARNVVNIGKRFAMPVTSLLHMPLRDLRGAHGRNPVR